MATVAQSTRSRWNLFREGVVSLRPLQGFFAWFFRALAICATFAIVVCSIIIGMEIAAHDAFTTNLVLVNLATITQDVLNAAIEGAMLGCIALAKQAREAGDTSQKHRMLTMGVIFLILTITTIGVQVFKPDGWDNPLLFVRCGAGLIYAAISHFWGTEVETVMPQRVHDRLEILFQEVQRDLGLEFSNRLQTIENRFRPENIETALAAKMNEMQVSLSQEIMQKKNAENEAIIRQFEEIKASLIESILSLQIEANNAGNNDQNNPPNLSQNNMAFLEEITPPNLPKITPLNNPSNLEGYFGSNNPANLPKNNSQNNAPNLPKITPSNFDDYLSEISEVILPDNAMNNLDEETIFDEVIKRFPKVASWRSSGQRSVSFDEIIEATNLPKKLIKNQANKPTKNGGFRGTKKPNNYQIFGVIMWLKTTKITPANFAGNNPSKNDQNNPPNLGQITPSNLAQNNVPNLPPNSDVIPPVISRKITQELPPLNVDELEAELKQNTMPDKGPNTDELEAVIIPDYLAEREENSIKVHEGNSTVEVLTFPVLHNQGGNYETL